MSTPIKPGDPVLSGGFNGKVRGAGGHIQHFLGVLGEEHADRFPAPQFVDAEAEEMVQEIIAVRDVVEHLCRLRLFGVAASVRGDRGSHGGARSASAHHRVAFGVFVVPADD